MQVPTGRASAGASNASRRVPRPPRPAVSSPIRPLAPPHLASPFSASRAWGEHPVGANDADWSTGGLCQSGDLLERDRAVAGLLLAAGSKVRGVTVTTRGSASRSLHGHVPVCHGRHLAAGHGHTGAERSRPTVTESLGPLWGYHLVDVNIALGNLVHDVAVEETAFR